MEVFLEEEASFCCRPYKCMFIGFQMTLSPFCGWVLDCIFQSLLEQTCSQQEGALQKLATVNWTVLQVEALVELFLAVCK